MESLTFLASYLRLNFTAGMHAEQFKIVNVENNEELASVGP